MHMLSPTAGLPLHQEPPLVSPFPPSLSNPQDIHTDHQTPANILSASVSLNSRAQQTDVPRLLIWISKGVHIKHPESLIEAVPQGWPKVAAFQANKEELIRGRADERGGEWHEMAVHRGHISAISAVFS